MAYRTTHRDADDVDERGTGRDAQRRPVRDVAHRAPGEKRTAIAERARAHEVETLARDDPDPFGDRGVHDRDRGDELGGEQIGVASTTSTSRPSLATGRNGSSVCGPRSVRRGRVS